MQEYLPLIKTSFSDWTQLILSNPGFTAALVIIVWILAAIFYSIQTAPLKKKTVENEKARNKLENKLNSAQHDLQKMEAELTANTEEIQKVKEWAQTEAQKTAELRELLSQRNQQISDSIQSLVNNFDLDESPPPATNDLASNDLWQHHGKVIDLLTSRMRNELKAKTELKESYEAEKIKRADKEAVIENLQNTLTDQAGRIFSLEQALENQKSLLLREQEKAQHVLSQTLEKHLAELSRLTELEQQALDLVHTQQQLKEMEGQLTAKEIQIAQLKQSPPSRDKAQTLSNDTPEETAKLPSETDQPPVTPVKEPTRGISGKIKNLFVKSSEVPMNSEAESAEDLQAEKPPLPATMDEEQPSTVAAVDQFDKLKNLFGKSREKPISEESDSAVTEYSSEPTAGEPSQASSAKNQFKKIKNLFGKDK